MSKKITAIDEMLGEIQAEYEGIDIPEDYALKVHEVSAILKENVTDSTYEAICTAFKLGFARGKDYAKYEFDIYEIIEQVESINASSYVLGAALSNEKARIPDDMNSTYLSDLNTKIDRLLSDIKYFSDKL